MAAIVVANDTATLAKFIPNNINTSFIFDFSILSFSVFANKSASAVVISCTIFLYFSPFAVPAFTISFALALLLLSKSSALAKPTKAVDTLCSAEAKFVNDV